MKMIKKIFISLAIMLILIMPVFAGYKGPTDANNTNDVISVEQAKHLEDDSRVVLRGKIDKHLEGKKYVFSDETGNINVDIDDKLWHGFSVDHTESVEIHGEVDKDSEKIEIEVKTMQKIQ
ncbi:MAG: OB fold stress tolerance protein YgiW [Rickettsiales bacterium]|nr:MAG: OB fold stress tolerance protein YgiW [Rickettsiales bacterium]